MATPEELTAVIDQSDLFDSTLREATKDLRIPPGIRNRYSLGLGVVCVEHGRGIRQLLRVRNTVGAFALFRPQLEALVRQVWIYHCAPEGWIDDFSGDVPEGSIFEPGSFPDLAAMVADLERRGRTRESSGFGALLSMLGDSHHSFTHGGLRAIQNALLGMDTAYEIELVKVSNAVTINAIGQLLVLSKDSGLEAEVWGIARQFDGCFLRRDAGHLPDTAPEATPKENAPQG